MQYIGIIVQIGSVELLSCHWFMLSDDAIMNMSKVSFSGPSHREIHRPAAFKTSTNHPQACEGDRERYGRSHISRHVTLCLNMASKN